MEGEGQGRREGQKQPPECLAFVQLKVKYKVSTNVSVCGYSEYKSIFIHMYYNRIFIWLDFLSLKNVGLSSNQLRNSIAISPFSEIL